jgi:hypothetical protein
MIISTDRLSRIERGSSGDRGAQCDVEAGTAACQAHEKDACPFKDVGHLEPAYVEGRRSAAAMPPANNTRALAASRAELAELKATLGCDGGS